MSEPGKHNDRLQDRPAIENIRTGVTIPEIEQSIIDNLNLLGGRVPSTATPNDWYNAVAYSVRDRILSRWMDTIEKYLVSDKKSVSYLSAEFLIGPQLLNNILNLNLEKEMRGALKNLDLDFDKLVMQEHEPGLGNGGLGRLAACYLDSMASLGILAVGYGIRYEFGIFKQTIQDGRQVEMADHWLHLTNPWEIIHPEIAFNVSFGGYADGNLWKPARTVRGIACDVPITGYQINVVNLLRLWKAEATESFDFQAFNIGAYWSAVQEKINSENITKVLYPNDEAIEGKRLRLEQQYFFVSCSLQDMIRVQFMRGHELKTFHEHYAVQLNDTHPSIAIAELMRLFVDEYKMDWDQAWDITQKTFAYTNHTLLPEALEKWSLPLFQDLLPRHLQIIFEINHRFLDKVRKTGQFDAEIIRKVSIIDENGEKFIRMAHLACIGSHAVNGVAELHTELLKKDVLQDFYKLDPDKIFNITNGVTPRRWLLLSNPRLAELITSKIGTGWICNMEMEISKIEPYAEDAAFREAWQKIKQENKEHLALLIQDKAGVKIDPNSIFDVQVKRIHEYKRQHLNILHIIARYLRIKKNPKQEIVPRTYIFGGKAAPSYFLAKLIIKLINSVAEVVNNDQDVAGRLKVVFFPDFNVKNGHVIYPAANLSEQISTAGKEASGTGNMKFAMNGALTIGTLDGANIEIWERVGDDNFFLFGLTAEEVHELDVNGYNPSNYVEKNLELKAVLEAIKIGLFSPNESNLFKPIVDSLIFHDPFKV
nr:glycogen/starch/alpha-glucan phosphorylase [Parachlamydiaceae bacterium]